MDGCSGKRPGGGKRAGGGVAIAFRDASGRDDRSAHCNRLVCSNRLNLKSQQVGNSDRDKSSTSVRTSGKAIVGSSSKAYSAMTNYRKASQESRDQSSFKGTRTAETNTVQLENINTEPSSSTARVQLKLSAAKTAESSVLDGPVSTFEEVESYRPPSSTRNQKQIHRQSGGRGNQETCVGSSSRQLFGPRSTGQTAKMTSHGHGFNASRSASSLPHTNRYGIRNLGCTSISDVLPSGCSSPDSSQNGRVEMVKRRGSGGEYFPAKGRSTSATAGSSSNRKNSLTGQSLSLSERPSQPTSRRTKYWMPSRNGVTSVRTRRTINEDSRHRVTDLDSNASSFEPSVVIPQLLHSDVSVIASSSSSQQALAELPIAGQNSCVGIAGRNENEHNSPIALPQDCSTRQVNSLSIGRDGYRRYDRDGIAEVLLALERIEQDEELTYEQLLILETNLFLSGLGFRDQHRDMRLDIDNMSYEELLALGDKMGTVSTGLTEEQLSNCLKRSFYMPESSNLRMGCAGDDLKCSICQEEYVERDEVGTLRCDHHYHLVCVHQWLRLKNWCPICKAHASDS